MHRSKSDCSKITKYSPPISGFWNNFSLWKPTSPSKLYEAEMKLLNSISTDFELQNIEIDDGDKYLKTLITKNPKECDEKKSLLLLHGMGSGIGLWCNNIDAFACNRKVYAIDLLGFGSSSRPIFPQDRDGVEREFVESIEQWRQSVGLESFILLGHSMGAYVSYAYAVKYHERVEHLILVDPWGFSHFSEERFSMIKDRWYLRFLYNMVKDHNPLGIIRLAGPLGPSMLKRSRSDLVTYFNKDKERINDEGQDYMGILDYVYHCNAQYPAGEKAYKTLSRHFLWAESPMIERCTELDEKIDITFIFGEDSWMDKDVAFTFKQTRSKSNVHIEIISRCGHHVYAEGSDRFNSFVNNLCDTIDNIESNDTDSVPIKVRRIDD